MVKNSEAIGENCIICGSDAHVEISSRIREGNYKVLECSCCSFVFLQGYDGIDYLEDYGSLTCNSEWSQYDAMIKRSESLSRFNSIVANLINYKNSNIQDCNILELGAGIGASIYGLKELVAGVDIDCIELNRNDTEFLQEQLGVKVFNNLSGLEKKYDVIYGHHVFEHFIDPKAILDEIYSITYEDSVVYFSLPNFDDYYRSTLNSQERDKYLEFNFHLAHPYYYTANTFSRLIEDTAWQIESIDTIQDYSIVNYFNWYINGEKSKDIEAGTKVDDRIRLLNDDFIQTIEKSSMGNNLSVVLKKK